MTKRTRSIGIFDSGFGGVEILRHVVDLLPEYNYIYLGDTARTPYGTRTSNIIYEFTEQAVDFLFEQGCEVILIACNTASSEALRRIQQEYLVKKHPNKRVLGVIIPTAETVIERTKSKRVGVIATEGTVASKTFCTEINKLDPKVKVFQQACPLLVPIVECGEDKSEIAEIALKKYLKPIVAKKIDQLILGCTHYGILEKQVKRILPKEIKVISQGKIVASKFENYLERHPEIEKTLMKKSKITFYTTDLTTRFQQFGSRFFGKEIKAKIAHL